MAVGYVCLLALQLVPAVRSTRTAPSTQCRHWGSKSASFLDRLCCRDLDTQLPCCRRRGTDLPVSLARVPGYLGTPKPSRWLPGPAGRRNYKEPPHLGRRDLGVPGVYCVVLRKEGRPSPRKVLASALTSSDQLEHHQRSSSWVFPPLPALSLPARWAPADLNRLTNFRASLPSRLPFDAIQCNRSIRPHSPVHFLLHPSATPA